MEKQIVIIRFIGNDDSVSMGDLKALEKKQNEAGMRQDGSLYS